MNDHVRRLRAPLILTVAWAAASYAAAGLLRPLTGVYVAAVRSALDLAGVSCVREGATIYTPGYAHDFTLADTGLFWWGALVGLGASLMLPGAKKALVLAGGLVACAVLHIAYGFATVVTGTAHVHGVASLIDVVWYGVLFSLLLTLAFAAVREGQGVERRPAGALP
jgi:hypothetical protein